MTVDADNDRRPRFGDLDMRLDRPTLPTILGTALAAFVPLLLIANVAVEAASHARGIGFVPQLRYVVLVLASVAAAFAQASLETRQLPDNVDKLVVMDDPLPGLKGSAELHQPLATSRYSGLSFDMYVE